MKVLSSQQYEMYKVSENEKLIETLNKKIQDIRIAQARVYIEQEADSDGYNTWHQVKCEFVFENPKSYQKEISEFVGFERRPIDRIENHWRMFYLNGMNSGFIETGMGV